MARNLPTLAITSGEPAGIGPELCAMLAEGNFPARLVLIGDYDLLTARAQSIGVEVHWVKYDSGINLSRGALEVLHQPLTVPSTAGQLNPCNSAYVLNLLDRAIMGCINHEFSAMVTAPVHKGIINDAGIAFTGHTEYLAARTNTPQVVMMLVGGGLRVALATTHLALKDVSAALTQASLETTLRILHTDLVQRFHLPNPRILVAGLNPHSGEGGHMGREEIEVIYPVLARLKSEGMHLLGPLPADTLFTPSRLSQADCVLAMYHDQGLPVLKYASFGEGVNVTLGLPFVRTSVDHGTALDLAGTGKVDPNSLYAAINLAIELLK